MFRDFHVIRGKKNDTVFFPESFKFYAVSPLQGDALTGFLSGGRKPAGEVKSLLRTEAEKAQSTLPKAPPLNNEVRSLCLYLAHDCNLSCTYCYNERGRAINPLDMMDGEVAEAAFRRFFRKPGTRYSVSFYGGEPLLNFKTIRKAVEAGDRLKKERGIDIAYSMTTNGTLLNREIIDFLGKHLSSVTVSVDGPPEVNDLHRRFGAKEGSSYERAVRTIRELKEKTSLRITVKGTLAGDAVPFYGESIEHLRGLGADAAALTPVAIAPGNAAAINNEQHKVFVRRYLDLHARELDDLEENGNPWGEYTFKIVAGLLTKRRLFKHCNAGRDLAVTADGRLYACHRLAGEERYYMGKVNEEKDWNFRRIGDLFAGLHVNAIEECRLCWARYLCGGSCYAHAYSATGTVYRPDPRHCTLFRQYAEVVIRRFLEIMADPLKKAKLYRKARKMLGLAGDAPHA